MISKGVFVRLQHFVTGQNAGSTLRLLAFHPETEAGISSAVNSDFTFLQSVQPTHLSKMVWDRGIYTDTLKNIEIKDKTDLRGWWTPERSGGELAQFLKRGTTSANAICSKV